MKQHLRVHIDKRGRKNIQIKKEAGLPQWRTFGGTHRGQDTARAAHLGSQRSQYLEKKRCIKNPQPTSHKQTMHQNTILDHYYKFLRMEIFNLTQKTPRNHM